MKFKKVGDAYWEAAFSAGRSGYKAIIERWLVAPSGCPFSLKVALGEMEAELGNFEHLADAQRAAKQLQALMVA